MMFVALVKVEICKYCTVQERNQKTAHALTVVEPITSFLLFLMTHPQKTQSVFVKIYCSSEALTLGHREPVLNNTGTCYRYLKCTT